MVLGATSRCYALQAPIRNVVDLESLAVIGLGASNSTVVAQIVTDMSSIAALANAEGIKVAKKTLYLIDRDKNHGHGKAWGIHAHPSMLSSGPALRWREGFNKWLHHNEHVWRPEVERYKGDLLATWFQMNSRRLANRQYDEIFMPRFIYGIFKRSELLHAIELAPPWLTIKILDGEVVFFETESARRSRISFRKPPELVELTQGSNGRPSLRFTGKFFGTHEIAADLKLVGIGPPPGAAFPAARDNPNYFADTAALNPSRPGHSFPVQFKQAILERHRASGAVVEVGILGSGLSCLDIINLVHSEKVLRDSIKLTAISRSGEVRTESDVAPESVAALQSSNLHSMKGVIADVVTGEDGRKIVVRLTDTSTMAFDVVVQALGFGTYESVEMMRQGFEEGIYTVVRKRGRSWLRVPASMQLGDGYYANGTLVYGRLAYTFPESRGFLETVHDMKRKYSALIVPKLLGSVIDELDQGLSGEECHARSLERFSFCRNANRYYEPT